MSGAAKSSWRRFLAWSLLSLAPLGILGYGLLAWLQIRADSGFRLWDADKRKQPAPPKKAAP